MSLEPTAFRDVMGHFATGVCVVTGMDGDNPVGMTANAVCSLSLDPLLLLVCFDNGARTLPIVRRTRRFGVNVLAAGEEDLARLFASKLPERHKFADIAHSVHDGVPVLDAALAWVGCELNELLPGGDHTIGVGAVRAAESRPGEPLIWYRGRYGRLAPP